MFIKVNVIEYPADSRIFDFCNSDNLEAAEHYAFTYKEKCSNMGIPCTVEVQDRNGLVLTIYCDRPLFDRAANTGDYSQIK